MNRRISNLDTSDFTPNSASKHSSITALWTICLIFEFSMAKMKILLATQFKCEEDRHAFDY